MSNRLVIPRGIRSGNAQIAGLGHVSSETASHGEGDRYWDRVAKYIPGEIIAAYISLNGVVASTADRPTLHDSLAWTVFTICLILTPAYFIRIADSDQPKVIHATISTLAFCVWAYAIGGPFIDKVWWIPEVGAIALGAFTLIVGAFQPKSHH